MKGFTLTKDVETTEVYHSLIKGDYIQWHRQLIERSRPISTILLSEKHKAEVILDINEYLQSLTARWYENRDIP
jgi:hypothetical protein